MVWLGFVGEVEMITAPRSRAWSPLSASLAQRYVANGTVSTMSPRDPMVGIMEGPTHWVLLAT